MDIKPDTRTKESKAEAKTILTSMSAMYDEINTLLDKYANMLQEEFSKAKK